MKWVKRILITLGVIVGLLLMVVAGALWYLEIPSSAAGVTAKTVCSTAFVAGRPADVDTLMEKDVLPASPFLKLTSAQINTEEHYVTGKFLGVFSKRASLVNKRGCVLDAEPDPTAVPYTAPAADPAPWPEGDAAVPESEWPAGLKADELKQVIDDAFADSGDPLGANARGVAVIQDGKLLLVRDGKDIQQNVALHGWSMTKTVAAMLAFKKFD